MSNSNLQDAKKAKNDEFYTQYEDIDKELQHYAEHFEGKTVYCNCDNPAWSNFWQYFVDNFEALRLNRLISTYYEENGTVYKTEKTKEGITKTPLEGDGDFRSNECVEILKEADIVVTNPPFSLFREYIAQLMEYNKKFIVIGNQNAITYKEIFPLLKENKMWLGYGFNGGNAYFSIPKGAEDKYSKGVYDEKTGLVKFRNCLWFCNLDISKRHEEFLMFKNYTPEEYHCYDNYDAINVDKVADIPCDYVPCWFKCNHACSCEWAQNSGFSGQALCEIDTENSVVARTEQNRTEQNRTEQNRTEQNVCSTPQNKQICCLNAAVESWECQSLSSTSSIQNNSKLYDSEKEMTKRICSTQQGMEEKYNHISESSYEEKCNGAMGVPITFLDKYNSGQFEVLGLARPLINGKRKYARVLIKRTTSLLST